MERVGGGKSGGRLGLRLLLRALRWRSLSASVLFLVAVVAVAGSAFGPAFLRSSDDSAFTTAVQTAPAATTDVDLVATGGQAELTAVTQAAKRVDAIGDGHMFKSPVVAAQAGATFALKRGTPGYQMPILAETDICRHIQMVRGSCPTAQGIGIMSSRSMNLTHVRIGQRLQMSVNTHQQSAEIWVRIEGEYQAPTNTSTDYWNGANPFGFGTGGQGIPLLDPVITTQGTVLHAAAVGGAPALEAYTYLRPGSLRATGFSRFDHELNSTLGAIEEGAVVKPGTALLSYISSSRHADQVAGTVVEAIVLELVLLALLVLVQLVSLSGADRALEVAIARRRGFRRLTLLVVAVGEPVTLLVVALPVGLVVAAVAMELAGHATFVRGTPVGLDGLSLVAAGAGFVGGLIAAAVGSWSLWRGADRSTGRGRGAAILDAFIVALAAAGFVALETKGSLGTSHLDPVAALAPGLLAVGVGVVGLRLATLLLRALVPASRYTSRVAGFLALREVVRRRPEVLRQLLALSVASVLAIFAVTSYALASANRTTVADFQTGAKTVLTVDARPGVDPVTAVRAADPSGKEAMAVEVDDSPQGAMVAVDGTRFAAVVGAWPKGLTSLDAKQIGAYLAPPVNPPITFTGSTLDITATLPDWSPHLSATMSVFNEVNQNSNTISLPTLRAGTHTYAVAAGGFCASPCRIANLMVSGQDQGPTLHLTLNRMRVGSDPLALAASKERTWSTSPTEPVTGTTSTGVTFTLSAANLASGVTLVPGDQPAIVPAVVTSSLDSINAPQPPDDSQSVTNLDGNSLNVSGEVVAATLPAVGNGSAVLVDLSSALANQTSLSEATDQVWLVHPASRALLARLKGQGLTVVTTTPAGVLGNSLAHSALALAYQSMLYIAPAAALLGIGSAAFAFLATRRRRRHDLRALETSGLSRRTLVRSVLIEQGLVLAVAWIIGGAVGYVASRLALASLPQFVNGSSGLPLAHGVPMGSWLTVVVVLAGAFIATAAIATAGIFSGRSRGAEGEEVSAA